MRFSALAAALAMLAAPVTAAHAQRSAALDWNALGDTAVQLLADYIRVNTTNPPGNEMAAIKFLIPVLEREGFTVQVLDTESTALGPSRGNLYVRLKGDGAKKGIALVHHMDVVPATPKFWSVDPFGGVIKDGYIYGSRRVRHEERGHRAAHGDDRPRTLRNPSYARHRVHR